ncbi:hypothetical protein BD769DRAFT_1676651 [Suillus cothurnatus]|nr:hypothetical protein BD769DRAFT_1676651 [Suillus cothurnatus]
MVSSALTFQQEVNLIWAMGILPGKENDIIFESLGASKVFIPLTSFYGQKSIKNPNAPLYGLKAEGFIIMKSNYSRACYEIQQERDKSGYISSSVPEFLNVLFKPWQVTIIRAKDTMMFFMGCGAIVNNIESFCNLHLSVLNPKLSSAIAFTALHFQPSFTCHLIVTFAEHVLVKGFSLHDAFPKILGHSYQL